MPWPAAGWSRAPGGTCSAALPGLHPACVAWVRAAVTFLDVAVDVLEIAPSRSKDNGLLPAAHLYSTGTCKRRPAGQQAALDILRRDSEVLKCHSDRWDAIWYAELGSSAAILNAGYNIASMLHRCAQHGLHTEMQTALPSVALMCDSSSAWSGLAMHGAWFLRQVQRQDSP